MTRRRKLNEPIGFVLKFLRLITRYHAVSCNAVESVVIEPTGRRTRSDNGNFRINRALNSIYSNRDRASCRFVLFDMREFDIFEISRFIRETDDRVVRTWKLSEAPNETVASMIFYLIVIRRTNVYTKICQITRAPGLLHEISTVERVEFFAYQKCFSIKRRLVEYAVMEKTQLPVKCVFSKLDA